MYSGELKKADSVASVALSGLSVSHSGDTPDFQQAKEDQVDILGYFCEAHIYNPVRGRSRE